MKNREIYCLNNISRVGTGRFRKGYTLVDEIDHAAGVLVRSADMKAMDFPPTLRAIGRAGAGVTTSRSTAVPSRASSYSTPRVPMPMP